VSIRYGGLAILLLFIPLPGFVEWGPPLPEIAGWLLGDNLRTRRAYLSELEARAERLEREQEESARRAAAEEQARIARELHDVLAHNVSVMVVQAAAANDVFETQPQRARQALRDIERTGRSALTELRRLLGRVRQTDFAPQPGLSGLEALVDGVRAAGLPVTLRVEGELDDLPAGLDLSAYRIVQEALTNAIKHAGASAAEVRVRRTADEVELEVVDDGAGPSGNGRGQGLIGMRERASLLGGEVEAGPKPGGGFRVRAKLPL
jgi:signal transduction histidine kinase